MSIFNFFRKKKSKTKKTIKTFEEEVQTDVTNFYYKNVLKEDENLKENKNIVISDNMVVIKKIDYIGFSPVFSENKEYMVCCKDSHIESINGMEKTINGKIVVCKDDNVLFQKEIPRPHDAKVSNNGIIIINDWLNRGDLCGEFLIFDDKGKLLFNKKVEANLYNNGLSNNGKYACFQTANSNNENGAKLFIVDINEKKLLSSFQPIEDWGTSHYEFDEDNEIIKLHYKNKDSYYRYNLDGTFLDYDKLEQIKLDKALKDESGYGLKDIAYSKLDLLEGKKELNLGDYSSSIELIKIALGKDMSDYNKAVCYRKLGEIYEEFNLLGKAVDNFNKAVTYYPKIGVKRKITSLTSELNKHLKE